MTPDQFGASQISYALSKDEAIVRTIATALPLESRTRQGSRRAFTLGDATAIVIVDDLTCAGLPKRAAFAIASALVAHFVQVVADDAHRPWLIIWADADASIGFDWRIETDKALALEIVLAKPLCTVLNVHDAMRSAVIRLCEAKRALTGERSHG